MRIAALCTCLLAAAPVEASGQIDLWVRPAGTYGTDGATPQARHTTVNLADLTAQELVADDVQFREKMKFRGVPIDALWGGFAIPPECDAAILHFRNGMAVPYTLNDKAAAAKLGLFVATAFWESTESGGTWSSVFPTVTRASGASGDSRPVFFEGNKVVSLTRWHPALNPKSAEEFSPWQHIDNLTGVEFVKLGAYWNQFRVGEGAAVKGFEVFRGRCQFCHGARGVGASYGWDYVRPLPVFEQRDPDSLLMHVKYRPYDAAAKGLMMPAFKDVTPAEAKALHAWMKALADKPLRPYAPKP